MTVWRNSGPCLVSWCSLAILNISVKTYISYQDSVICNLLAGNWFHTASIAAKFVMFYVEINRSMLAVVCLNTPV
jgi:hypothetical protein